MKALLVEQIGDAYLDAEKSGKWSLLLPMNYERNTPDVRLCWMNWSR